MYDHTFLNLQTTISDIRPHIKSAVSLVIAYGHFDLPRGLCGYVKNAALQLVLVAETYRRGDCTRVSSSVSGYCEVWDNKVKEFFLRSKHTVYEGEEGTYGSLQLLIQPWICAPGTHNCWVDQGSVEYEVFPTLLHTTSTGNWTPDILILSPTSTLLQSPNR